MRWFLEKHWIASGVGGWLPEYSSSNDGGRVRNREETQECFFLQLYVFLSIHPPIDSKLHNV